MSGEQRLLAGIELGGTKIVCTLGTGPDDMRDSVRIPTTDPATAIAGIEKALDGWIARGDPVAAIGIASFGPVDLDPKSPTYGHVTATTKPGWAGTDIAQRIAHRYRLPTGFDTDVNGAALAEGRWGAAQGLGSWTYITVGTGVGAGIVVDRKTLRGRNHVEAGHMVVRRTPGDDWPGWCSFHGDCIEGLASGPAIASRTGMKGEEVPLDHPVWDLVADALAAMIHNLVLVALPQKVLMGGGVMTAQTQLFPMIRDKLARNLAGYAGASDDPADYDAFVVPPALGDRAGPLGSLALALDALKTGV